MKKYISILFLSLITTSLSVFASEKIKIACVGDSITFGAGIKSPENRYPQQLGAMLGDKYQVENFGVSGTTLLNKGDKPYTKQKAYKDALALNANIVIIKLGTNDSKMQNWAHIANFETDLNALIDSFAKQDSKTIIYLCTPCPAFLTGKKINKDRVKKIIPTIEKVAKERSIKIIDLNDKLADKAELFPDKIHPNDKGAKLMAEIIKAEITK